jgi:23S rRNA pseudouridine2604 synthase
MKQRINQYLAEKNIASRREADELIAKGLVFINGKKALLGQKVDETVDQIEVKNLKKHYVYYAYNKPVGIVTTTPQAGEKDIIHHTHFPHKVFPIGRLDKDSHGLIIMTNDRTLTKKILEPNRDHEKEYAVKIQEKVTEPFLKFMSGGVTLPDGTKTKPCKISKIAPDQFSIILTEGKNRQIRRMVASFNYTVVDLKRIRIGKVFLRTLKPGMFIPIDPKLLV